MRQEQLLSPAGLHEAKSGEVNLQKRVDGTVRGQVQVCNFGLCSNHCTALPPKPFGDCMLSAAQGAAQCGGSWVGLQGSCFYFNFLDNPRDHLSFLSALWLFKTPTVEKVCFYQKNKPRVTSVWHPSSALVPPPLLPSPPFFSFTSVSGTRAHTAPRTPPAIPVNTL